ILDSTGIGSWGFALLVAVSVVSGARALARAPFTLPRSLRAGPDTLRALRRWARDELNTVAVSIIAGTLVTLPLYALLRTTPVWWLPAWLMFATLTVAWQVALPVFMRLRANSSTSSPPSLAARVKTVGALAGLDVGDVIVTGKPGARCGNAYVVGLGRTRRVVLEHAVAAWPPELVDQVVAHELGHWRLGHAGRRLPLTLLAELAALAATAAALSFSPLLDAVGITAAGDPRSYPFLLVLGAVVALPVRCLLAWRDRAQERAADRFALDLLDRPEDFGAMLQRAADDSGVPRSLPWWRRLTASHPPIDERVTACRRGRPALHGTKGT
ncbi:MAG TPA: M48 family metalloprotease, partial [Acidimicrobiales bacterium]|nr:M48 family metalloprotease [Acidimicrobiales bacterium]